MTLACLVNGDPTKQVPGDDRGLAYGDGLFETLVMAGGRPWFWQAHMDRLVEGCTRLNIAVPPQEILLQEARQVAGDQSRCVVKIIITRGQGGRGYRPGPPSEPLRVVSAHTYPTDVGLLARDGVRAEVLNLRLAIQPALGGMKHLNRLEQVLAGQELESRGADEGILLDQDGHVISALSGNLFVVSGERLLTPRMDRSGVRGVVRSQILHDFNARCELRRITLDMLAEADEVLMCNAVRGIIPILAVDAWSWPAGPVTRELQGWFQKRIMAA